MYASNEWTENGIQVEHAVSEVFDSSNNNLFLLCDEKSLQAIRVTSIPKRAARFRGKGLTPCDIFEIVNVIAVTAVSKKKQAFFKKKQNLKKDTNRMKNSMKDYSKW